MGFHIQKCGTIQLQTLYFQQYYIIIVLQLQVRGTAPAMQLPAHTQRLLSHNNFMNKIVCIAGISGSDKSVVTDYLTKYNYQFTLWISLDEVRTYISNTPS